MKRIIIGILIYLVFVTASANKSTYRDVLIVEIDSLLQEAQLSMFNVDFYKAIEQSKEALNLSIEAKYDKASIQLYHMLGQCLLNSQEYSQSLVYLSSAEKVENHAMYPLYMSQIYKLKAQIYFYLNMGEQSIAELDKALRTVIKIKSKDERDITTSHLYESLTVVHGGLGNMNSSFHYMKENMNLLAKMDEAKYHTSNINLFTSFGNYYIIENELDSAKYYLDCAMHLIDKYEYKYKALTLRRMGDLLLLQSDYRLALSVFLDAINNSVDLGVKVGLPELHDKVAQAYQSLEMLDSANVYLDKKVMFENEMLKEKVSATQSVVQALMHDEKKLSKSQKTMSLIIAICATMIAGLIFGTVLWRKRRQDLIDEVSEETQQYFEQKINMAFDEVMKLAKSNDPTFIIRFQEVYSEFYNNLVKLHPDLSITDLNLCAMTYLNFSTQDIAQYSFVETRSVQARRNRLRKKINLPSDVDLFTYLQSI